MESSLEMAAVGVMVVSGTTYFLLKKKHKTGSLFFKALATFMPALLLLRAYPSVGAGEIPEMEFLCTLTAVFLYMAADVLLECRFIAGVVCFGMGHIFMAAGLLQYASAAPVWCLVWAVLFLAAACAALHRYFHRLRAKKLLYPGAAYVTVLSVMASFAVAGGLNSGETSGLIPALGGVCFVVSDILLAVNRIGRKRSKARGAAVLILYYLSVYLLAMRVWN